MALPLAVNIDVNVHKVGTRAFFEPLDHHGNAMRDLVPHKQQRFLADDLCHQLFFRHVRISIVIKVVRALHRVTAQGIKQLLTVVILPDADRINIVKHPQGFQLGLAGLQIFRCLDEIGLIDHGNGRAAALFQRLHQHHFRLIEGTVGLKQHHGHIHIRDGIAGSLVHPLAQLIVCLVHARGIQQDILQRAAGDNTRNAGAGGLGLRGHNGHFLPYQQVGQAGFAHIGAANDRHKDGRSIIMSLDGCFLFQNSTPVLFCIIPYS